MVRVSVHNSQIAEPWLSEERQLPIGIRRGHAIDDEWGWCDLPVRFNDSLVEKRDDYGVFESLPEPSPYDLQVMMVWGSHKAMLGMMAEQDMIEGVGLRVALALARENP